MNSTTNKINLRYFITTSFLELTKNIPLLED
nr:MAG TPA: hypothetical protein [Caudoviricetes sp.]